MRDEPNYLDELVRLDVLRLRREHETQTETITELDRAGFSQARIADLLGTSPGTVKVTLQRAKKKTPPPKKES